MELIIELPGKGRAYDTRQALELIEREIVKISPTKLRGLARDLGIRQYTAGYDRRRIFYLESDLKTLIAFLRQFQPVQPVQPAPIEELPPPSSKSLPQTRKQKGKETQKRSKQEKR